MRQKKFLSLITLILLVGLFPLIANAQSTAVPDWVKNNALWWAEGKISEQEYLNAIQFLLDEGIINLESSSEKPKNIVPSSIASDNDRVQYYIVTLSSGDFVDEHTFTTISSVAPTLREVGFNSLISLDSLPSKDKTELYKLISRYINPGARPQPIDIKVELVTGDGTVIVTEDWGVCEAVGYSTYTQDKRIFFQFSQKQQIEIRDSAQFKCAGVQIIVYDPDDPKKYDISSLNPIPSDNDRVQSFLVHFFDGDIRQVRSFNTFATFSPSIDRVDNEYVTITAPGNPFAETPQFFLESLPSKDKQEYYYFLSKYINPVRTPEPFDVSIDLITGDGTILLRWNYSDCFLNSYSMRLQGSQLRYPFAGKLTSEVLDKTDFECAGNHLQVHGIDKIDTLPIRDKHVWEYSDELVFTTEPVPSDADRAQTYVIHFFSGDLEETHSSSEFPKFTGLTWDRGPYTPPGQAKQFDFGFVLESLPSKEKRELYEFLSRYLNPGKQPEPFDADIDVITGDNTLLQTLRYTGCQAADLKIFLHQSSWIYTFNGEMKDEIREKYTFYCEGHLVNVPLE